MNESAIFTAIDEACTSLDPVKLARAADTFSVLAMRESDLGFERGSYLHALNAAHKANHLARVIANK